MNKDKYALQGEDKLLDKDFATEILLNVLVANKIATTELTKAEHNRLNKLSNDEIINELSKIERDGGQIEAIVDSTLNKVFYDKSKQNYLDIASEMVNKLANKHALFDANKRTALNTGVGILENGLAIKMDLNPKDPKYMNFMLDVVDNWQKAIPENKQLKEINDFLDNEVEHSIRQNKLQNDTDLEPEEC